MHRVHSQRYMDFLIMSLIVTVVIGATRRQSWLPFGGLAVIRLFEVVDWNIGTPIEICHQSTHETANPGVAIRSDASIHRVDFHEDHYG